jgi:hypothetical protein
MDECHWHRIDVVIAAAEGSFELKDGTTYEIHTIHAGDWTLTARGTLHAFAAESPGVGVVGYSEHIEFAEIEELPASELPGTP